IAQRTVSFSDGSSLRYTYAEFYRTNGAKLHKIGITPDVNLPQKGAQVVYDTAYVEGETFEEHLTKYLNAMGFSASSYSALLEAYQSARSIPVTGVYDDATKGKINKDLYEQRQLGKVNQLAEVVDLLKK
ncbi:MAG: S41 family peptidase, partial [Bacilli bacterium]|nr:S41 family peptidase [Bacilli bacterium]